MSDREHPNLEHTDVQELMDFDLSDLHLPDLDLCFEGLPSLPLGSQLALDQAEASRPEQSPVLSSSGHGSPTQATTGLSPQMQHGLSLDEGAIDQTVGAQEHLQLAAQQLACGSSEETVYAAQVMPAGERRSHPAQLRSPRKSAPAASGHHHPTRTASRSASGHFSLLGRELVDARRSMKRQKSAEGSDLVDTGPAKPQHSGHQSTGPYSSDHSVSGESAEGIQAMPHTPEVRQIPSGRSGFMIPAAALVQAHAAAAWGNRITSGSLRPSSAPTGSPVAKLEASPKEKASNASGEAAPVAELDQLESLHGSLVDESTARLLGAVGSEAAIFSDTLPAVDALQPSWTALKARLAQRRRHVEEQLHRLTLEQAYLQEHEHKAETVVADLEQLRSGVEQPAQREEVALRLLLDINVRPDSLCSTADADIGQQLARFCSQLLTMRGWEEDAFGHGNLSVSELARLLASGGSTAAARHRMSVGRWATSSCSILQLQRLPLAMYRRIAKEYAASLAGLLSMATGKAAADRQDAKQRMAHTVIEASIASLAFTCKQPWRALSLVSFEDSPSNAAQAKDPDFWADVVDAARLSPDQQSPICNIHRAVEARLARLAKLRSALRQRLHSLLAPAKANQARLAQDSKPAIVATAAEIKQNRNDQALAVLELGATLLLQICTPDQAAAIVARAYPLHVQPRAIAAAVARKHAAEQRATSTC